MKKTHYLLRDGFLCLLLALGFLWSVSFILLNLSIFNPFTGAFKDFSFLDLYYAEKMQENSPGQDIILINVEQRDRFEIHQLMEHVQAQNPKVLGLDIIFKDTRDPFVDSLLQQSFSKENVVLSKAFITDHWQRNASIFKTNHSRIGYSNLNFDRQNNVIRTFEGKKLLLDSMHYSFSSLMAQHFLEDDWVGENLETKVSRSIPINYRGDFDSFLTLSYDDCMSQETLPFLKDKIVLLGYMGTPHGSRNDIEDKFFTPLNENTAGKSAPDMFGVLIHANIIQMLITQDFISKTPKWLMYGIAIILTYLAIVAFMFFSTRRPARYMLSKKITQLMLTVLLLWFSLWLYKKKILFQPELIIGMMVISVELIGLYKIIAKKLNTRYKWKSYFFQ